MNIKTLLIFLSILIITSCTSSRYAVNQVATSKFGAFDGLEIQEFKSNVSDENSLKVVNKLATQLKDKITKHNKNNQKPSDKQMFTQISLGESDFKNPLIASCSLTSYEKGNRAARYFIGFGAGKAYSTVKCEFINKQSGVIISDATFDGELGIGIFGGSASEATSAMLKSIVKYIAANY